MNPAVLNYLQSQQTNQAPAAQGNQLPAEQAPTFNPFNNGIKAAIESARVSLDMTEKQQDKAMRRSILSFANAYSAEPRQKGFMANFGSVARSLSPAILEHDNAEDMAFKENNNLANQILAHQAAEQKRQDIQEDRAWHRSHAEKQLDEQRRHHDMMSDYKHQKLNMQPGNQPPSTINGIEVFPIQSRQESNAYTKDKKALGSVLNEVNELEEDYTKFRKDTANNVFDPMSATAPTTNKVKDYWGRFFNNKELREETANRKTLSSKLNKFVISSERALKGGGVMGPRLIEMFKEQGIYPNLDDDTPEIFESKLKMLKDEIVNSYKAANLSLTYGVHIDPSQVKTLETEPDVSSNQQNNTSPEEVEAATTDSPNMAALQEEQGNKYGNPFFSVAEASPPVSKKDTNRVKEIEEEGDSWLPLIGKSALKGVSSIADVPRLAAETTEGIANFSRKIPGNPAEVYWGAQNPYATTKPDLKINDDAPLTNYSKYVPTSAEARASLKKNTGIDLEPHPGSAAQRITSHGVDFASSMAPWGLAAKGINSLKNVEKIANPQKNVNLFNRIKNTTSAKNAALGVGLGSGVLQETGIDPLISDVTSSVVVPGSKSRLINAAHGINNSRFKIPAKLMGMGPKRLDLKTAQAARDLDVELPAAVLTDSTLTGLADQTIAKTPFLGNILKDKYNKSQHQIHHNLNKIYDEIGPVRTPEIEKRIFDLYEKRRLELPNGAAIKPTNTIKALDKIKINTALLSPDESKLISDIGTLKNHLNPTVSSKFGDVKIPAQDIEVDKLIGTKQSLNSIIKWDVSEGVRNYLRKIQHGLSKDIEEYGKNHPKWYHSYKEADNLFAKTAKREKVEGILRNEGLNEPEDLSYAMLSRAIKDKKKNKIIKKNVSSETYAKINKLGTLADAMVRKNRRVPNPSGTAATATTIAFLSGVYMNPTAAFNFTGLAGLASAGVSTKLLTDKKFVDMALKFAEEGGKSKLVSTMELNKRAKEITGYTLNSIYRGAQREINKEKDGLQ